MPRHAYAAITTIPTPDGLVYVRKTWAAKQNSFLLVLDGPTAAIERILPEWRPRSPTSTRTQVTPPTPAGMTSEIMSFAEAMIPVWMARATGRKPVSSVGLVTIADCIAATERTIAATVRPSSLAAYRKQWKRIATCIPTSTALAALSREMVQAMVSTLAARGAAATSIRNVITAFRRALTPAIDAQVISSSLLDRLNAPRAEARPRKHLTREQRDHLLSVAAAAGRDIGLLVAIGLLAGLRRAEILALTWGHVDLETQVLRVQNSATFKTKSGKNRIVPLCTHLSAILRDRRPADADPTAFVIMPDKPVKPGHPRWSFAKSLRRVAIDAGVPWLTPHSMRRAFATLAVQGGVSIWKVKGWLGHSGLAVTEKYVAEMSTFDADVNKVG